MYARFLKYMVMLAALALLVPLSAFARPKSERTVEFHDTLQVGSTQLKAGTYEVEWQGTPSSLRVSFLQDGKTLATTNGKMVEKNIASPYDDVITTHVHNTLRLEEIDFHGRKEALVLSSNQIKMK